ncbi:MAG: DNA polymerase III subunit delta [Actinomycetota bacterium]|nr:DNA polymerase III subunit delta [Actinomycetota bacterium]
MSPIGGSPVLLVNSRHRLLVEEEFKVVKEKIAEKVDLDFNLDIFEAGEDPIDDILQSAETIPMASDKRYVIVKEAQKLSSSDIKKLGRYLEDPSESSLMIIFAIGLKKNSSLMRKVGEMGRIKGLEKRGDQIPGWLRSRFKEHGLEVTGKAIAYIHEALGDDLMALENAVEKISLYHDGDEPVDLDEVLSLVTPSAERPIFELVDRVALGDVDQSVKLLRRLLRQGEKPTYILYTLTRRFRRLVLYKALKEEGHHESEILRSLHIQGWMLDKKLKPQALKLDEDKLRKALSLLVRVEWGIKSGQMDEIFAVEAAVSGLAVLAAERQPH